LRRTDLDECLTVAQFYDLCKKGNQSKLVVEIANENDGRLIYPVEMGTFRFNSEIGCIIEINEEQSGEGIPIKEFFKEQNEGD
jgi:hypothetical protein